MTVIPELAMRQIERWCAQRVPEDLKDRLRVECRTLGRTVAIVERRAGDPEWTEREIARLHLDEFGIWSMLRSDGDGGWLPDPDGPVASTPPPLLAEI
ncbi:hypothetical protein Amsp01_026060 [Amycolatopsis sp. NBRC 101858]|uniref:DUF3024 domain-containing protein n=1 Tax=Amycolatopsis sp. NBRC 101858 TaxID=3032200 RepID=UPI0024A4ECC5|nr:hypothetical protein [Amycolatopsis sp. NBRC 101858]GLY36582.1 hypothetical protein Amsp01_026060 [Amycolatopsis sp. NBRC 101858]